MAIIPSKLRINRSLISGNKPMNLKLGELAVNIPDKSLFVGDDVGNIIQLLGKNGFTEPQVAFVVDKRNSGVNGGTNREKYWNVRTLTSI